MRTFTIFALNKTTMKILKFKLLKDFGKSADYVGNDRYVFNISGNKFRLITIVVFFQGFLHIRFIGTHAEYDKIKDIKNI